MPYSCIRATAKHKQITDLIKTISWLNPSSLYFYPSAVSSIPVSRLMAATESDKVSYANLIRFTKLSLKFTPDQIKFPPPTKHFNVQLHYCDEDGDKVLFSSDVELMDALSWAVSSKQGTNVPILVVHATILPLSRRPSNASTATSASIGSTRCLMVQQHRSAVHRIVAIGRFL